MRKSEYKDYLNGLSLAFYHLFIETENQETNKSVYEKKKMKKNHPTTWKLVFTILNCKENISPLAINYHSSADTLAMYAMVNMKQNINLYSGSHQYTGTYGSVSKQDGIFCMLASNKPESLLTLTKALNE